MQTEPESESYFAKIWEGTVRVPTAGAIPPRSLPLQHRSSGVARFRRALRARQRNITADDLAVAPCPPKTTSDVDDSKSRVLQKGVVLLVMINLGLLGSLAIIAAWYFCTDLKDRTKATQRHLSLLEQRQLQLATTPRVMPDAPATVRVEAESLIKLSGEMQALTATTARAHSQLKAINEEAAGTALQLRNMALSAARLDLQTHTLKTTRKTSTTDEDGALFDTTPILDQTTAQSAGKK